MSTQTSGKKTLFNSGINILGSIPELGFNEFAEWSKDKDLLIFVDYGLLLCLPDPDTYDVIFVDT